jgi:nicotinate-nucleotide adenylyltransferase
MQIPLNLKSINNNSIIIFGGTFDPIHNGHTIIANKLYELFGTPVTFVPTAAPNYKARPIANNQQRLDMLKLALDEDPRYIIDENEIVADEYLPSYYSLTKLRDVIGKDTPIHFLVGGDSLVTLDTWDNWQELFNLTNFIIALRPGYELKNMPAAVQSEFNERVVSNLVNLNQPSGQIYLLKLEPIDISSTQIRNKLAHGLTINNLVPSKVVDYIDFHKLYC